MHYLLQSSMSGYQKVTEGSRQNPVFILYVSDQNRSAIFYRNVLASEPILDVEGMTEFALSDGCLLGLMPEKGAERLLGSAVHPPSSGNGIPRCELYLYVPNPLEYLERVVKNGGTSVSELKLRSWGDSVCYGSDLDGHILAFAKR